MFFFFRCARVQCTHAVHACSARMQCTRAMHACSARLQCTCAVHVCSARVQCTHAVHACSARKQCTHALHACSARMHCTHALLACSARMQCTHARFLTDSNIDKVPFPEGTWRIPRIPKLQIKNLDLVKFFIYKFGICGIRQVPSRNGTFSMQESVRIRGARLRAADVASFPCQSSSRRKNSDCTIWNLRQSTWPCPRSVLSNATCTPYCAFPGGKREKTAWKAE